LIALINIIISGWLYVSNTFFLHFSQFPVNGLTTFYHFSDDLAKVFCIEALLVSVVCYELLVCCMRLICWAILHRMYDFW